jgi:hypothetical protein
MASLDGAVLTQILAQLESLQLSQQVLQAKVISFFRFAPIQIYLNMSALSSSTP